MTQRTDIAQGGKVRFLKSVSYEKKSAVSAQ